MCAANFCEEKKNIPEHVISLVKDVIKLLQTGAAQVILQQYCQANSHAEGPAAAFY